MQWKLRATRPRQPESVERAGPVANVAAGPSGDVVFPSQSLVNRVNCFDWSSWQPRAHRMEEVVACRPSPGDAPEVGVFGLGVSALSHRPTAAFGCS